MCDVHWALVCNEYWFIQIGAREGQCPAQESKARLKPPHLQLSEYI